MKVLLTGVLALLGVLASTVFAQQGGEELAHRRCKVKNHVKAGAALRAEFDSEVAARYAGGPHNPRSFTIDTHIHIVANSSDILSRHNDSMVAAQLRVLNTAYAPSRFSFRHKSTSRYVNDSWARIVPDDDDASTVNLLEWEMKSRTRKGRGYDVLNVWFLSHLGDGLLGFAEFPTRELNATVRTMDGVVAIADSMPGGRFKAYSLGMTLVHEVGHWLGLFHTFESWNSDPEAEGTCEGPGDYVRDTPTQKEPTYGCPSDADAPDTCPSKSGKDAFHNYMDYSDDRCLSTFSRGQTVRALYTFAMLRWNKK